ncbi:MAG: peptide-methionine (R)-S-oxide reductase MsrB [Magnetococcus sp. DMHC-6]
MKRRIFLLNLITLMDIAMISIKPVFGSPTPSIITKTDEEWQRLLTEEQYHILRQEGTEPPFSSPLNTEKRQGSYHCAGCQLELFTSTMKYDSGTGWPSFVTTISEHIATKKDFRMILPRTEYHCARCGGHQGHVFDDGPPPTHQRWCNNGLALQFIPR